MEKVPWITFPYINRALYVTPRPRIFKPWLMERKDEYDLIAIVHPLFGECIEGLDKSYSIEELFSHKLKLSDFMKKNSPSHLGYKKNILELLTEKKSNGTDLSSATRVLFEDRNGNKYGKLTHILKDEGLVDKVVFTDSSNIDDALVDAKLEEFNRAAVVGTYTEHCVKSISEQLNGMGIRTKVLEEFTWP